MQTRHAPRRSPRPDSVLILDDPDTNYKVVQMVRSYAASLGFGYDDQEDCVATFAEKMTERLRSRRASAAPMEGALFWSWLMVCLRNHVKDLGGQRRRREQHEPSIEHLLSQGVPLRILGICRDPNPPLTFLLSKELRSSVAEAAEGLTPTARKIFLRYLDEGGTMQELAESAGVPYANLRKMLFRSSQRVAKLLAAQGLDSSTAREYLPHFSESIETPG